MIYETAVVVRSGTEETTKEKVKAIIEETIKEVSGELLLEESWGLKTLAQPFADRSTKGYYLYFIYQAFGNVNEEIERRYKINEDILRFIVLRLGEDVDKESILKSYVSPNSALDEEKESELEKEKKLFLRKKSCWFSAKKAKPDWKDPKSYSWLVNEFGKISPARVTGLRPKFQRMATSAIKRGRCIGLISYVSNDVAR